MCELGLYMSIIEGINKRRKTEDYGLQQWRGDKYNMKHTLHVKQQKHAFCVCFQVTSPPV